MQAPTRKHVRTPNPPKVVLVAGAALAAGLGLVLSLMLIAMLQHAFDPPPDSLAIPWRYLTELFGGALLGTGIAAGIAAIAQARMPLGAILREQ